MTCSRRAWGRFICTCGPTASTRPRPVSFRWIHGDQAIVVPGTLSPAGALRHGASVDVQPHQVGPWRVEVATEGSAGEPPEVIYTREFTLE